jgi:hypothetical protein
MKPLLAFAALATFASALAADYGPPVGTPMPPFEAPDQNGKTHTLKDLLGPNGAAIVFYRSADW